MYEKKFEGALWLFKYLYTPTVFLFLLFNNKIYTQKYWIKVFLYLIFGYIIFSVVFYNFGG